MRLADLFWSARLSLPTANPALDAEVLLQAALGLDRARFWLDQGREIEDRAGLRRFRRFLARRRRHEPVAYILRRKEFYGLDFFVDRRVLIPRPETELLAEEALERLGPGDRVLDIGAGSGNLSVVLARRGAEVTAVEASAEARRVLRRNLARHGLAKRVAVKGADLFPRGPGRFALIVSNPPYASASEWRSLGPGVRLWEPRTAVVGGERGTEILARIIAAAPERLLAGGWLLLEFGCRQRRPVETLLRRAGFADIGFRRDLGGHWRVVAARLP